MADRAQSFIKTVAIVAAAAAVAAVPLAGKGKPPAPPTTTTLSIVDGNGATVPDAIVANGIGSVMVLRDDLMWNVDWATGAVHATTAHDFDQYPPSGDSVGMFIDPECSEHFFALAPGDSKVPDIFGTGIAAQATEAVTYSGVTRIYSAASVETATVTLYQHSIEPPCKEVGSETIRFIDTSSAPTLTAPADLVGPLRLKSS